MFRVVILGSGASLPTLQRGPAAVAVQYEGDQYLFDCGEGAQLQWRRAGLRVGRLRAIFISHLHGDHLNGLVGFLQTLSLGDRTEPLTVAGPSGLADYLRALGRYQGFRVAYELNVVESAGGELVRTPSHTIECGPLDHGIATLGFCLAEEPRPGRFDVEAAGRLGLAPGPEFGRLQRGLPVEMPDGTTIEPGQVLGPPRPGRRFAYCVDTRPCDEVIRLARDATVFLCDSTFATELEREAHKRGHSTAAQAARMAARAGVSRLVLTHISARYGDPRPMLEEARAEFANTCVAADQMEIEL